MLTMADVMKVCPDHRGLKIEDLSFHYVYSDPDLRTKKGLFVPFSQNEEENSQQLRTALNNGAVAAIWRKDHKIPAYIPNHFPIFVTEDVIDTTVRVVNQYIDTYTMKDSSFEHTCFSFPITIKHNDKNISYVNAVKDKVTELDCYLKKSIPSAVLNMKGGEEQC